MPDNPFLIATKQLRQEQLSGFLLSILNQNFTGLANNYFASLNVVHLTGLETITGQKSFVLNPNIPYSGTSGQAISRLYVDTGDSILQNQINQFQNPIFISGDQFVSGEKNFNRIIITSGRATGIFEVSYPLSNSGAISLGYLNSVLNNLIPGNIVFTSGDNNISGINSYVNGGTVYLPEATNPSGGVPLSQLDTTSNNIISKLNSTGENLIFNINDLQNQINSIDLTAAANVTGFGGVLTLNAQSGNLFLQGRGMVSLTTNLNVISISGHTLTRNSQSLLGSVNILSGIDRQFIPYNVNFDVVPNVLTQLVTTGRNIPILNSYVSGQTTSGFNIIFSNTVLNSGYKLTYWAATGTGLLIDVIQGEQGIPGLSGASVVGPMGPAGPSVVQFYNPINYYSSTIITGLNIYEQFAVRDYFITGIHVGVVQTGSGIPLSGTLYNRVSETSEKINIFDFSLRSGRYYTGVNCVEAIGIEYPISIRDRVGLDIKRGISGAIGLTITIVGYTMTE